MTEMVNPYIAGAPVVEARMFFGREDVFDWIQNSLTGRYADHILVIHGQRRVGKTSVLKQLGNRLPEKYIPVFFDLQGRTHTTLDRFLWWLAREIVRVLKQERDISVPAPEKEVFTADPEYFETQFLPGLRPVLGERALLLTFDEFDNLEESEVKEDLARPLIDYLRRLMGEPGLNFIFSIGSSGRKLENMQAAYTEFFKTALYKKISFLSKEQSAGLVTRPVEGLLEYDREAVERIYGIASGHPYFTQLTCHELFSLCQRTGELRIRESDVESILDDVVERGTVNLKFTWDEASDIEKWSLAALAHQEGRVDNPALAEFLRKQRVRFTDSDLTSGVLRLREKDILTEENRFVIYLLKLWLKKNRSIEQVREELTEVNPIANRYIEIGLEFHDSGQYDKAIENFREALAVAPENIQAQVNIALAYQAQGALDLAVAKFEKALAMDDEDVTARSGLCGAYLTLGDAAREKGKLKDAVLSYQKVLDINAEHTEARQRMAEISRQRAEKALTEGRDEEALAAFAEALKFTPEDESLSARYEQAKVEKRTKVLVSLLTKAEKEQSARNWVAALSILNNALELAPEDEKVQKRLAAVKEEQRKEQLQSILARAERAAQAGRWGLVIAALEEYLALEPGDAKVQARIEEARRKLHEAEVDEACTRARSLARQERWEEAAAAWGEVLKIAPEEGETVQAEIEKIKKAQGLAKSYAEAQKAYANKNYDQAVNLLKGIINQDENYKDASRLLAQAIDLRRTARKWWQSKWLWGVVISSIVAVVAWFAYQPVSLLMKDLFASTAAPVETQPPSAMDTQTALPPPTDRPLSTATAFPLPYTWARLNSGQFLPRDQITAIVVDPKDPGVIYAGTQNAGIYKSIDGGLSWQPMQNGLGRAWIHRLVIDPSDPQTLYASVSMGGVYKTTDGGETWQAINEGLDFDYWEWVSVVTMDAQDGQHLYYTPSGGIYESTNGGESWTQVQASTCPNQIVDLVVHPVDGKILFTGSVAVKGCEGGVYKSEDGGRTWAPTGLQGTQTGLGRALWIDSQGGEFLYAAGDGLYASSDGGQNWYQTGRFCNALAVDLQDGATAYCGHGDGGIDKTSDGGQTWQYLSEVEGGVTSILISPHAAGTLFAGGQGLHLSTDGGAAWVERSSGLGGSRIDLMLDPQGGSSIYADSKVLYHSSNSGRTWESFYQRGYDLAFDADGTTLYCLANSLLRSSNNGQTWKELDFPQGAGVSDVAAHPQKPGTLFLSYGSEYPIGLYISSDGGDTWQESTTGLGSKREIDHPKLYIDQEIGKMIYAVGTWSAYRSSDAGNSWEACGDVGGWLAHSSRSALAINPLDENWIFLATQGRGILISHDSCRSWEQSINGLGSLFVNTVAIYPNNPDTVYAGTDAGAFVSFDGGQHWGSISDGLLGATVVYSIVVDPQSNVYAATPYGIFKLEGK